MFSGKKKVKPAELLHTLTKIDIVITLNLQSRVFIIWTSVQGGSWMAFLYLTGTWNDVSILVEALLSFYIQCCFQSECPESREKMLAYFSLHLKYLPFLCYFCSFGLHKKSLMGQETLATRWSKASQNWERRQRRISK